jgi:hypothetical protein
MSSKGALFEAIQFGYLQLRSGVVMAPMTHSRARSGNVPIPLHATYYGEPASEGLIVTQGTQLSPAKRGYCRTPGLYIDAQIAGWRDVTPKVHAAGGQIVLRLTHCGRVAAHINKEDASEIVAASDLRADTTFLTDSAGDRLPYLAKCLPPDAASSGRWHRSFARRTDGSSAASPKGRRSRCRRVGAHMLNAASALDQYIADHSGSAD